MTSGRAHAQRPHATGLDLAHGARQVVEHRRQLAAEQVGKGGRIPLVWDVHEVDTAHQLEELHAELRRGADAGRAIVELALRGLRERDELRDAAHLQGRIDDQHVRRGADHRKRGEVAHRIVAKLAVERGRDAVRRDAA